MSGESRSETSSLRVPSGRGGRPRLVSVPVPSRITLPPRVMAARSKKVSSSSTMSSSRSAWKSAGSSRTFPPPEISFLLTRCRLHIVITRTTSSPRSAQTQATISPPSGPSRDPSILAIIEPVVGFSEALAAKQFASFSEIKTPLQQDGHRASPGRIRFSHNYCIYDKSGKVKSRSRFTAPRSSARAWANVR